jgi:hypothetical protein
MTDTNKIVEQWWHDNMTPLTAQLSNGVLNEMKRRISNSNIRKEKLTLNENTERMTAFFKAEIRRYKNRIDTQKKRQADLDKLDVLKRMIRELVDCTHGTKCAHLAQARYLQTLFNGSDFGCKFRLKSIMFCSMQVPLNIELTN